MNIRLQLNLSKYDQIMLDDLVSLFQILPYTHSSPTTQGNTRIHKQRIQHEKSCKLSIKAKLNI